MAGHAKWHVDPCSAASSAWLVCGLQWGNALEPDQQKHAEAALRHELDTEVLEQKLALEEDEQMVQEFQERLDYNLGRVSCLYMTCVSILATSSSAVVL